jgi:hypothetical protein
MCWACHTYGGCARCSADVLQCTLYVVRYSLISAAGCMLHRGAWHVAHSARRLSAGCIGARCIGARCIGARCIGARCIGAHCIGAGCTGARCSLHRRRAALPQRTAVGWVVCCACAARLGEGRAVRRPSGGAMRSCAGRWRRRRRRRALHGQGHRAVRRRGDIRHQNIKCALLAVRRCEAGRCLRGRVTADGVRGRL